MNASNMFLIRMFTVFFDLGMIRMMMMMMIEEKVAKLIQSLQLEA